MSSNANIVTQYLIHTIRQQIQEHHVVVWFDPENQYRTLAHTQNFPDVQIYSYDPQQGFMALRRQLEQVWGVVEPPQLLIYVPISEEASQHALVEYTTAGVTVQPSQQPVERNTRLNWIARQALENILPSTNLENVIGEIEKGQLTLDELDEIAGHYKDIHYALAIIYRTENTEEIILQFLTVPDLDAEVVAKNANGNLTSLLKNELDLQIEDGTDLSKIRLALQRHLLLIDFLNPIDKKIPAGFSTIAVPQSKVIRETAVKIVKAWRLRHDLTENYVQTAQTIATGLNLINHTWSIDALKDNETFADIDSVLQLCVENAILEGPSSDLVHFSQKRCNGFWPGQMPLLWLRWQIIIGAGQVILKANQIKTALKGDSPALSFVKNYTDADNAWCLLDTTFRRLERDEHNFDFETPTHDLLRKLIVKARTAYADVLHNMTELFMHAYERAAFEIPELPQQSSIFRDFVQPAVEEYRTAYFLIDALRFEMALELYEQMKSEWDCQLYPALATIPTITEVGMAALLPGAEKGLTLMSAGAGKLSVIVEKSILKNKADRINLLGEKCSSQCVATELNQIAPLRDKKLRAALSSLPLAIVTAADEIDGIWENQPEMALRMHEDVFLQLRRGIRSLLSLGVQKIILTTDHGFISGDDLMSGTPIDPPGGDTVDLHRRIWIGKGGSVMDTCLRKPISALGLGGDLDFVTPIGLGCFKVPGGSTQYYHGGMSLQELVIPIMVISVGKSAPSMTEPEFNWLVTLGSKQISTRFFSVTISGNAKDFFAKPPQIRAELRSGDTVCSSPITASYGFDETTRDVRMKLEEGKTSLQANTITLHIVDLPQASELTLHIINAETGLSLKQIQDIPVAIAF